MSSRRGLSSRSQKSKGTGKCCDGSTDGGLRSDFFWGNEKLQEYGNQVQYDQLIKKCTLLFSGTFFLSAVLNFVLAIRIFKPIPTGITESEAADIVNKQIADMTWLGYVVIALPLMVITTSLFYYCLRNLSKLTQLSINDLMRS